MAPELRTTIHALRAMAFSAIENMLRIRISLSVGTECILLCTTIQNLGPILAPAPSNAIVAGECST